MTTTLSKDAVSGDGTSFESESLALLEKITDFQARVVVIGLGMVGRMQVELLSRAGYRVTGYDQNASLVNEILAQHNDYSSDDDSLVSFTSDAQCLSSADVILICIRIDPPDNSTANLGPLLDLTRPMADSRNTGALVVLVTTSPAGTTCQLHGLLKSSSPVNWFVGLSPERISGLQSAEDVLATPRLVAGVDEPSSKLVKTLIGNICVSANPVSSPVVAELAKLLENTFRIHSIGLIAEITRLSHANSIDAHEVCEAAATKPFGYLPFYPSAGVGGHCLKNDLRILKSCFIQSGLDSSLLDETVLCINTMASTAVARLLVLMGGKLESRKLLVVGVGYKPGAEETSSTPAAELINELILRQSEVLYFDSRIARFCVSGVSVPRIATDSLRTAKFDAIVIVAGDSSISLEDLYAASSVVLDTGGGEIMAGSRVNLLRL